MTTDTMRTNESIKYSQLPSFDELVVMANEQPEALEALRQNLVNEVIDQAQPHTQSRLRGLQFQIDAQRSIAKTPLAACVKLSSMMMDSFEKMRQELPSAKRIGNVSLSLEKQDGGIAQTAIEADYSQTSSLANASASNVLQFRR